MVGGEQITEVPWIQEDAPWNQVVVSTRIRLSRNLRGHNFPWKMDRQEEEELNRELFAIWEDSDGSGEPKILGDIDMKYRGILRECSFINANLNLEPWKSIALSPDNQSAVLFNWIDHLRYLSLSGGLNVQSAWDLVKKLEEPVLQKLDYVTDPELGYLNSEMMNCGTGLKGSLLLHLPALCRRKDFDKILMSLEENGMEVRGYFGEDEDSMGGLYQISNHYTLGVDEEDTLSALTQVGEDMAQLEQKARQDWLASGELPLKDKVFRSLGILSQAYLLTQNEGIKHLMNLRLGASLGFIPIKTYQIDKWMYQIKDHHLAIINKNEIKTMENRFLEENRAKFMREAIALANKGGQNV